MPIVLGKSCILVIRKCKRPSNMREDTRVKVHPNASGSDGGQVASIIKEALLDASAVGWRKGRHARVKRLM